MNGFALYKRITKQVALKAKVNEIHYIAYTVKCICYGNSIL